MVFHKYISTGLGIGFIGKGAGTVSSLATCIFWYLFHAGDIYPPSLSVLITLLICIIGVWSANKIEVLWGRDSNRVVIDEIAGMCITLLFVPVSVKYILTGFVLFRFFDIIKPLFISKLESLPGGWGVMADDILAGIYSNAVLQLLIISQIF